jgi:hypothetical protein
LIRPIGNKNYNHGQIKSHPNFMLEMVQISALNNSNFEICKVTSVSIENVMKTMSLNNTYYCGDAVSCPQVPVKSPRWVIYLSHEFLCYVSDCTVYINLINAFPLNIMFTTKIYITASYIEVIMLYIIHWRVWLWDFQQYFSFSHDLWNFPFHLYTQ